MQGCLYWETHEQFYIIHYTCDCFFSNQCIFQTKNLQAVKILKLLENLMLPSFPAVIHDENVKKAERRRQKSRKEMLEKRWQRKSSLREKTRFSINDPI